MLCQIYITKKNKRTSSYISEVNHYSTHCINQNMGANFINRFLSFFEKILKSPLSTYPKYPNKLQVSALIFFFRSFLFLPISPISWNSNKRRLVPFKNIRQKYIYLAWVFLFDFLIGVASPSYLLWQEFSKNGRKTNQSKMGLKKSTFQVLFAVGTFTSVCYSIFTWTIPAKYICLDYKVVSNFANYLHYGII